MLTHFLLSSHISLSQVSPQGDYYRERVISFVSTLLGDEGPGSIISYLWQQNWATALSAGLGLETETYDLIYIDITLTDAGVRNASSVIGVVMKYVMILCKLDNSVMSSLWEDYVQLNTLNFDYAAKIDPATYTS